ncbi:MAG: hypothetical protein ACOX9R_19105 [Armatimonadota bacterium]|jgi:hypothetical protein
MSRATCRLMGAVLMVAMATPAAVSETDGRKDGTLEDLRQLLGAETLATGVLGELPIIIDASELAAPNHHSRLSRAVELKPGVRYTLGVLYRASGRSMVTAGVKWLVAEQPAGLVDVEDHRVRWPATDGLVLRALTFTSDHEHTTARIILKAFGGMTLEVEGVALVEGWYAN